MRITASRWPRAVFNRFKTAFSCTSFIPARLPHQGWVSGGIRGMEIGCGPAWATFIKAGGAKDLRYALQRKLTVAKTKPECPPLVELYDDGVVASERGAFA